MLIRHVLKHRPEATFDPVPDGEGAEKIMDGVQSSIILFTGPGVGLLPPKPLQKSQELVPGD